MQMKFDPNICVDATTAHRRRKKVYGDPDGRPHDSSKAKHVLFSPKLRSPRGVVWWAVIETSFTVEPPTLLRDGGEGRPRAGSVVATIGEAHGTL
ncbi:hypothetical protein Hamer_G021685 [Homarus americanus]|uniref:Uncharacterized protein n=1 Tax=Homarus americanus TaxID=6706 RepID=A0A8J5JVX0_HOMAM|nr:hypothetical protein Hamer_G021685 [Homarus americanus]